MSLEKACSGGSQTCTIFGLRTSAGCGLPQPSLWTQRGGLPSARSSIHALPRGDGSQDTHAVRITIGTRLRQSNCPSIMRRCWSEAGREAYRVLHERGVFIVKCQDEVCQTGNALPTSNSCVYELGSSPRTICCCAQQPARHDGSWSRSTPERIIPTSSFSGKMENTAHGHVAMNPVDLLLGSYGNTPQNAVDGREGVSVAGEVFIRRYLMTSGHD